MQKKLSVLIHKGKRQDEDVVRIPHPEFWDDDMSLKKCLHPPAEASCERMGIYEKNRSKCPKEALKTQ
ncbi:MAG: hypothetical protein Q4F05_14595 [bacterium]|nr:hypothetical protein [bacterium]